jgi:hypothetical protein
MAELKTTKNDASVDAFLATIRDAEKQRDARKVVRLMQKVTREKPKMWGKSIVGFGEFRYRYASGREADWLVTGFSPRAQNLTLYLMAGFGNLKDKLKNLGKHRTSQSCLLIKRLADVDLAVLESIVAQGVVETRALDAAKGAARGALANGTERGRAARKSSKRAAAVERTSRPTAKRVPPAGTRTRSARASAERAPRAAKR